MRNNNIGTITQQTPSGHLSVGKSTKRPVSGGFCTCTGVRAGLVTGVDALQDPFMQMLSWLGIDTSSTSNTEKTS